MAIFECTECKNKVKCKMQKLYKIWAIETEDGVDFLNDNKTYKTVLADGKSVFESNDIKAIDEIRGLRDELIN